MFWSTSIRLCRHSQMTGLVNEAEIHVYSILLPLNHMDDLVKFDFSHGIPSYSLIESLI